MSSLFGQLCSDVATLTGRSELVAEIQLAVRDATKYVHMADFWQRDSFETLKTWSPEQAIVQLSIRSNFDRFRKFRYIKKFDLTTSLPKEGSAHKITEIGPDLLFDRYERLRTNVYYIAGDNFNIRLSSAERALVLCFYQYPQTDPSNYSSWIAEHYSPAITNMAAARIFRDTGQSEDAASKEKLWLNVDLPVIQRQDVEASTH